MAPSLRQSGPLVITVGVCFAVGAAVAYSPAVGLAVALAAVCAASMVVPSGYWIVAALVAALTFRGLVTLHVLPPGASYVDIPLAWGALVVAAVQSHNRAARAGPMLGWLGGLAVAVLVAWALHPSEVLRPITFFLLLGEPFAVI